MNEQAMPLLGVASTKYISGISNLSSRGEALTRLPLHQALTKAWDTDAHLVCYYPSTNENYPRLNKTVLGHVRAMGNDILTRLFVFDIDNPDHKKWEDYCNPDDWVNWFHNEFCQRCPWAANYAALYTTRGGARLVYVSDIAIPVDDAEAKHRWMVNTLNFHGLGADQGCTDWTRLFRLPYVNRDGVATSTSPTLRFYANWDATIPGAEIPAMERHEASEYTGVIKEFDEAKPLRTYADGLLKQYNEKSGREVQADWFKKAKIRLRGRDCYKALFQNEVLAAEGKRDSTLHSYVGQVIAACFKLDGFSPAHCYALFLEAVDALEPDADTPDWTDKLWDHIGRIWSREEAKAEHQAEEQAAAAEEQQEKIDHVIDGMGRWCKHPMLHSNDNGPRQFFANRHLICTVGNHHHVMQQDGTYDSLGVSSSSLVARIRILGMDGVVQTTQINENGGESEVDVKTLLNKYSCVASGIEALPGIEGAFIERIDQPDAVLKVPTYQLDESIEPEFNSHVDTWLRHFAGEYYGELCEWIAWALAFEEGPICALSIAASPGIGKKLLVTGLSECLRVPAMASAQDMVSDYQYGLMNSPFLVIDEGWPKVRGGMHPADSFRYMVDGKPSNVNRKFLAPVKVHNPLRIIFTANNLSVVSMLGADRDLTPEDREALTIRLKHLDLQGRQDAANWLRQMGGYSFTGSPGNRWIAGDSGEPSDKIIAKHFMYLYRNRGPRIAGRRFLVDGNANRELMYEFRVGAGSNPLVVETLLKMVDHQSPVYQLHISQDLRLWVTTSACLDYFRSNLASSAGQKLTIKTIANAYKSLCLAEHSEATTINGIKARWWELDPELLLSVARRDGRRCHRLEQLVSARQQSGLGGQYG